MSGSTDNPDRRAARAPVARALRAVAWAGGSVVLVLMLLWATTPLWAAPLLAWVLKPQGIVLGTTEMLRPRAASWQLPRLTLKQAATTIELRDVRIGYHWRTLGEGRLEDISIASVRVVSLATAAPSAGGAAASAQAPLSWLLQPDRMLQRLPWRRLSVDALDVEARGDGAALTAQGEAQLGAEALRLALTVRTTLPARADGAAPRTVALPFELQAAAGEATSLALLDEQGAVRIALRARVRAADDGVPASLQLGVRATLGPAEARLLQILLPGVPGLTSDWIDGSLTLQGRVPWPLPEAALRHPADLLALPGASGTAQFELALRLPQSRLEPLAGVAVLGHGTATLTFDAMTLAGESAVVALRCTLQRPWQIDYQEGRWQAGSGPQCALRGAQDELIIALRDATVERGAFALMADISGRVRDFTPQLTATFQAQREAENVVGALRLAQDARSWPIDFVAAADGERLRLSFDHVLNLPARALERSRLIEAGEVDLRAGSARYRGTLTRAGERWAGDVAVAFEALQLDVPALAEQKLALRPLTGEVALTLDERQGSFSGSLTAPIATPFTGTADWDSGRVNLAAPLSLSIDRPLLARLLRGWEHPVELTGGTLTGRLDYRGGPTDAGAERDAGGWILNGALTGGAGQLAGDPFTGLTLAWQASGSGAAYEWSTTDPGALTIARYDPGFPVTLKTLPLRLHADGEETQLELGAAQLELLGGQVDLAPARLSVDTLDGNLSLVFKNLALAEVLALHGDQIRGTGRLDGTLPLVLEAGALSIRDGRVDAQPPGGTISLDTALAQPSGQPGLDFALRALTDFRFSSLGGAVTYAPSGDLALALSLRGVNPAIERGRPIQYNLNVNNNVPMLLRSLQADRVITEQVEQRLNR